MEWEDREAGDVEAVDWPDHVNSCNAVRRKGVRLTQRRFRLEGNGTSPPNAMFLKLAPTPPRITGQDRAAMHASTPPHPTAAKYAAALEGLELDNPVEAFFDFCKERENVRKLRESGSGPLSEDPIFPRGRFLNVFR